MYATNADRHESVRNECRSRRDVVYATCVNDHVRLNERKNARTNARRQTNEGTDERTRTSERTNQQTTKQQTKGRTNERTSNTKIMANSLPERSWDAPGTSPESPKSTKNPSKSLKIALGAILANQESPGTRPERSKSGRGGPPEAPRTLPGRSWTAPGHS